MQTLQTCEPRDRSFPNFLSITTRNPLCVLPNERHAADDDWEEYETVNVDDPASGKKLPNEGHAQSS